MREELNFKGNQLNQINTVFTVGYVIMNRWVELCTDLASKVYDRSSTV
jgi:hypothetical protein